MARMLFSLLSRLSIVALLAAPRALAGGPPAEGYERLKWGLTVAEVLALLGRDYNSQGALEVRKRRAIEGMIAEFKAANPGYPPPSTEEYEDTLDADDFRVSFEYEEIAQDELRPQYFLKELGTEIEMDTGEGVIAMADEQPRKFFCFSEGRLWKVVEVHEDPVVKEDISFAAFAQRLERQLGPADKKEHAAKPGSSRRELVLVRWSGDKTEVHAQPLFARFLVVFQSAEAAATINDVRVKMRALKRREDSGDTPGE